MNDLSYQQLTEAELRKYIKQHPDNEDAFQSYLEIMRAKPNRVVVSTDEQLEIELKKRIPQSSS
jgi:SOS response regulatory protein OraA/RecX